MMTNTTLADPHKNVLRLSPQRQNDQLSTTAPRRMMRYPRRQLPARDEYRDTDGGADDDMAVLTARLVPASGTLDIWELLVLRTAKPVTTTMQMRRRVGLLAGHGMAPLRVNPHG
ncbi:hypothetical protein TESG_01953 [Trichophyton tonsurans CBS 112818]|uniref:Uncharacterized protein n=1 Tax=Trichophyton tonsurans (strain CBS 112818) TaxID=647933 RepID=F2RSY6_TRIT1|nr:hypothetical protein TESG_01953 [Trichophyton tonsurans CBS 112818]